MIDSASSPFITAIWLGIDFKLITDGGVALGTVLAGLAAAYAAFVGLKTYKDSVIASRARTLLEAEAAFTKIMPILMVIENPDRYVEKVVPLIAKIKSQPRQRLDDTEFELLQKLDNGIRFFYVYVLYEKLNIKHKGVVSAYVYYWEKMTDKDHKDLRDYIDEYYPGLRADFK